MSNAGWIGVDLDGTLAIYHKFTTPDDIGEPIMPMVERVQAWLEEGKDVRIFTARGSVDAADRALAYPAIEKWCAKHIGTVLPITNVKDLHMFALYDDRAYHVPRNTGVVIDDPFLFAVAVELRKARSKFPNPRMSNIALMEEVGELAKAVLDESPERVHKEAVQVACMAGRVATEGDPTVDEYRRSCGLAPLPAAPV